MQKNIVELLPVLTVVNYLLITTRQNSCNNTRFRDTIFDHHFGVRSREVRVQNLVFEHFIILIVTIFFSVIQSPNHNMHIDLVIYDVKYALYFKRPFKVRHFNKSIRYTSPSYLDRTHGHIGIFRVHYTQCLY